MYKVATAIIMDNAVPSYGTKTQNRNLYHRILQEWDHSTKGFNFTLMFSVTRSSTFCIMTWQNYPSRWPQSFAFLSPSLQAVEWKGGCKQWTSQVSGPGSSPSCALNSFANNITPSMLSFLLYKIRVLITTSQSYYED